MRFMLMIKGTVQSEAGRLPAASANKLAPGPRGHTLLTRQALTVGSIQRSGFSVQSRAWPASYADSAFAGASQFSYRRRLPDSVHGFTQADRSAPCASWSMIVASSWVGFAISITSSCTNCR